MATILMTLSSALVIALAHLWATSIHPNRRFQRKTWMSFADGISITYIFLELLPAILHAPDTDPLLNELVVLGVPEQVESVSLWGEVHPFLPLLIGFTVFYGLEKGVDRKAIKKLGTQESGAHFRVHMAALVLYKIVLGFYLAQLKSWADIVVFTLAMLMHFFVVDLRLLDMHESAYQRVGRWLLGASFLFGWLMSILVGLSPPVFAALLSFVAGGAVLMTIQEEFAEPQGSSFPAFVLAVASYGLLLLAI